MSFLDKITAQLPLGNKSENTEYFFALNIGLSEFTASVWGIFGQGIDILGQASAPYRDSEDLIEKAYQALDKSLGALEVEPQKILFGVPETWSLDDNLKEPYLKLLRKMLKEYDLSAVAYVTTTNAIAFYLQKQDGVPSTSILLGVGDFVEVTLVKGGKIIGTKVIKRGDGLFGNIEEALKQFTEVEVLPSKILVYPTREDEDTGKLLDDLMSYPWMQRLSFLHFPKIEVLSANICVESIILSAASELNPDVSLKHSFASSRQAIPTPTLGQRELGHTRQLNTAKGEQRDSDDSDLGFVKGDIKAKAEEQEEPNEEAGLKKGRSLSRLARQEEVDLESDSLISPEIEEEYAFFKEDNPIVKNQNKEENTALGGLESAFGVVINPLKKIIPSDFWKRVPPLPKFNFLFGGKLIIAPVILVVLVAAYIFMVKATVTVFVEPQVLERDTEVVADPKVTEVSEERKVIPGTIVETTVSGTGKAAATGTKQIGDPAKGKVVIYNKTSAPRTFSQGTVLVGSNNLKFTLDSSITVASQSAVEGGISFGKGTVPVTAEAIGPDSNLMGGSDLTISQQPGTSYSAKVDEALSGGTSKEVKVVTSDDQKKLQAKVTDELRQKAEEDLKGKQTEGKKIISEALAVADGKYTFSKAVNEQAGEFSLSATVRFKGTSYSDTDLKTIVSKLVGTSIPEGFQMNLQDMETQADVAKVEKDGRLIFKARFKAKLLPKLDLESLKREIKGSSVDGAVERLKKIENIMGAEIQFSPSLPGPLGRIPILDQNISINVSPK